MPIWRHFRTESSTRAMKILTLLIFTCASLRAHWCAPLHGEHHGVRDQDTSDGEHGHGRGHGHGVLDEEPSDGMLGHRHGVLAEDTSDGEHGHADPYRGGRDFNNNAFDLGDISVSAHVKGGVSICSSIEIQDGASISESDSLSRVTNPLPTENVGSDLTSWLQLIALKGVPGANTRLSEQASASGKAKGQPFPKIIGPLPQERVCIVGAGPAGLHMALSLKKRGYKKVIIFEKTNRVGGKTWDIEYGGITHMMSTVLVSPDYNDTFVPLTKEYGRGDLRKIPSVQFWRTNSAEGPFNKLSREEFLIAGVKKITNFTEPVKNLAAFYRDLSRYIEIHREMFGKYQGELMQKPEPTVMRRIRGTFLEFLKRKNLLTLAPFVTLINTALGYGYLDEISAFYGLMRNTPAKTIAWVETEIYYLKDGFQEVWNSIAEKENLDIRFNSNLVKVERTPSLAYLHLSDGLESRVETCDFLVWAAPMSELLKVTTQSSATLLEKDLFGSQTTIPFSSSIVNLKNVVRHGAACFYTQNFAEKAEHDPTILIDYKGMLAPNIRTKEGKAAYDEKKDEITTATVWQMGKEEISTSSLNEKLVEHFKEGFNVTDVEFIETKTWEYFPRWSPNETGEGRHWQVFEIQGWYRTWYAGSSVAFESVMSVMEYNNLLLRQMIQPVHIE